MITRLIKELRALGTFFIIAFIAALIAMATVKWLPPSQAPRLITGNTQIHNVYVPSGHTEVQRQLSPAELMLRQDTEKQNLIETQQYYPAANLYEFILGCMTFLQVLLMLTAASSLFGDEFSNGSIQRLLAQPVSRTRIWIEKTCALALFVITVLLLDFLLCQTMLLNIARIDHAYQLIRNGGSLVGRFHHMKMDPALWSIFLFGMMALATAPTLSLWLRQTHTTFWASIVLPLGVTMIVAYLVEWLDYKPNITLFVPQWVKHLDIFNNGNLELTLVVALWFAILYPLGWFKFKRLEV